MSRSYSEFCALAKGLDVLGDRWVLLIVRNLLLGPQRYTELRRDLPGIASNMLAQRLEHLRAHDLVAHDGEHYALTDKGATLEPVVFAIANWGEAHALGVPLERDHMRVRYLMTSFRRKIRPTEQKATIALHILDRPEQAFTLRCAPDPEVTQGLPEEHDALLRLKPHEVLPTLMGHLAAPEPGSPWHVLREAMPWFSSR